MAIVLASAWQPRGEFKRFFQHLPLLKKAYRGIAITLPPDTETGLIESLNVHPEIKAVATSDWSHGRADALRLALDFSGSHVHYVDFDRLIRWIETRREEWDNILPEIVNHDCLVIGRSAHSYQTHPRALIQTEAISNLVISYLVGHSLDVSAGSKSFSRRACAYIVANCVPRNALGTDAEWPVIIKRGGFEINSILVDGLDWESADRFQDTAADKNSQEHLAEIYDEDPENWSKRVDVAREIVQVGFEAMHRELPSLYRFEEYDLQEEQIDNGSRFHFEEVFDVQDYLYFYLDSLTPERTQAEVAGLVRELSLDSPRDILDLACGFGRHAIALAARGHRVTGVDKYERFLEIARQEAHERNLPAEFIQDDMRSIQFEQKFDHVLLLFSSFGYFVDEENQLVLKNIARALKPGGSVVIEIPNRDSLIINFQPIVITEKGQDLMIDRCRFDHFTSRWYNRRIVIREGIRKDKPFFIRVYNSGEIKQLISSAGMQLVNIYAGYEAEPLSESSTRMVIIARKPIDE